MNTSTRMIELVVSTMSYDDIYRNLLVLENFRATCVDAPRKAILSLNIECYRTALYIALEYI